MSEFHAFVVKIGSIEKHPNADTLGITKVFDYQVIVKDDAFQTGQLAVYVPIDSVVPDTDAWHFLCPNDENNVPKYSIGSVPEKYRVIHAKKLRGIFSQGMLMPISLIKQRRWFSEGDDVTELIGITKYEPPIPMTMGGECETPPPFAFPVYTDLEGMRRYPDVIKEGEEVVITEKLHGTNYRFVHDGNRLWVGSHTQVKKKDEKNLWWQITNKYNLETKLGEHPHLVFFGEIYGQVQDLKYDHKSGSSFRVFDIFDVDTMKYINHDDVLQITTYFGLDFVPILYRGPWKNDLISLCEGSSTIANNIREGFVVKPVVERWDQSVGRVILKRHGEQFLTRKKKQV